MKLLKDIIYGIRLKEVKGNTNIAVEKITYDSRQVNRLSLFVAVNGTNLDGHRFIGQAESKGACAIICEKLPDNLDSEITYIAVPDSSVALGKIASNFFFFDLV